MAVRGGAEGGSAADGGVLSDGRAGGAVAVRAVGFGGGGGGVVPGARHARRGTGARSASRPRPLPVPRLLVDLVIFIERWRRTESRTPAGQTGGRDDRGERQRNGHPGQPPPPPVSQNVLRRCRPETLASQVRPGRH